MSMLIDLTGRRYGRLKVLSRAENRGKRVFWLCECECDNIVEKSGDSLKNGETKSCGCLKKEQEQINMREKYSGKPLTDLTNRRFGRLKAIEQLEDRYKGDTQWLCECDCGKNVVVRRNLLITKSKRSCGCLKVDQNKINIEEKFNEKRIDGVFIPSLLSELRKDNKSGVKGVHWSESRQKWIAELHVKGERKLNKGFETKEEAIDARKEAEKKYHQPIIDKQH